MYINRERDRGRERWGCHNGASRPFSHTTTLQPNCLYRSERDKQLNSVLPVGFPPASVGQKELPRVLDDIDKTLFTTYFMNDSAAV